MASRLPAVLVTFATLSLSGARGENLDLPARQQTHWDQEPRREARTPPGLDKPAAEAGAVVGGDRAIRRSRRTALDRLPRRATVLSTMEPRGRLGAALGRGERERERRRKSAVRGAGPRQGARPRTLEAPPREPERHARRHPPSWPEKPAESPAAGAAQNET